ncbi:tRNA lysidine(34) synthetase TilS [Pseudokineococcus lusitanus]|uniref:tRNA(Ile)-lysidine synthase n=1 Tax=Pseudokineococcus lusitanus TaxID=763993 RepID=A0A3N1HLP3_9ACTN|nr:tRNA lysidine(34) synthetase TilS [Pseudokineococcus lusitanus]ROP43410.1 tRNA(Ile)-lysidine synthase [Pseudokineococcus lusitanus]
MAGPHPAVADVRRAVAAALADLPPGALVLVGCSGGPDSLALAEGLARWARPGRRGVDGRRAGAVVVDHGLQDGSAEVADRAADACRGLGLDPVEVVALPPDPGHGGGGPEARARDGRHAALADAAARTGAAAVLLGHTRDDQAEQVLLGLARGAGARSLAGVPPRRGVVRRPLLGLPRSTTLAACAALGLEPWHDPTNAPPPPGERGARRAHVRGVLLPALEAGLGPGVAAALARTAEHLREDADVLDALAADLLARARAAAGDGGDPAGDGDPDPLAAVVVLDVRALSDAPPALRRRALRGAAVAAGAPAGSLGSTHVGALDALVTAWRGQGPADLPGGVVARRADGRLRLARP